MSDETLSTDGLTLAGYLRVERVARDEVEDRARAVAEAWRDLTGIQIEVLDMPIKKMIVALGKLDEVRHGA